MNAPVVSFGSKGQPAAKSNSAAQRKRSSSFSQNQTDKKLKIQTTEEGNGVKIDRPASAPPSPTSADITNVLLSTGVDKDSFDASVLLPFTPPAPPIQNLHPSGGGFLLAKARQELRAKAPGWPAWMQVCRFCRSKKRPNSILNNQCQAPHPPNGGGGFLLAEARPELRAKAPGWPVWMQVCHFCRSKKRPNSNWLLQILIESKGSRLSFSTDERELIAQGFNGSWEELSTPRRLAVTVIYA